MPSSSGPWPNVGQLISQVHDLFSLGCFVYMSLFRCHNYITQHSYTLETAAPASSIMVILSIDLPYPYDVMATTQSVSYPATPDSPIQESPTSFPIRALSLSLSGLRRLLRQVLCKKVRIRQIEELHSSSVNRRYLLRFCDDSPPLVLTLPPHPEAKLLRIEQGLLEAELQLYSHLSRRTNIPLPRLLAHDLTSKSPVGLPFLLTSYSRGPSLSSADQYLSVVQQQSLDRHLGSLVFSLSCLKNDSFGPICPSETRQGLYSTWRDAFCMIMESALRDAEDMLVSLPYQLIRHWSNTLSDALDEIREARLVLLNFGREANRSDLITDGAGTKITEVNIWGGWAVWGDPLLAAVFDGASQAFLNGFGLPLEEGESARKRQTL